MNVSKTETNSWKGMSCCILRLSNGPRSQCCAYLRSISTTNDDSQTKKGVLAFSVVYGRGIDDETAEVKPWKEKHDDVCVSLPFSGRIKNPLYCPNVSRYIQDTWAKKVSFWSRAIVDMVEIANNMQIEDSNQFSEGVIRTTKKVENAYNHATEPAEYFKYRWDDTRRSIKQFVLEYQSLDSQIQELEAVREKRSKRQRSASRSATAAASAPAALTQDVMTQQSEDNEVEVWCRKGSTAKFESNLRMEFSGIFRDDGVGEKNSERYKYMLDSFDLSEAEDFMSYTTFNKFMSGTRRTQKPFSKRHMELIQKFINEKRPAKVAASR